MKIQKESKLRASPDEVAKSSVGFAFTLVELLVVIAVIGILAALIFPALGRVKDTAHTTQCASNLRQMGLAMTMYFADNHDHYPSITYWTQYNQYYSLVPYLRDAQKLFICPAAHGRIPQGSLTPADYPIRQFLTITNGDGTTWVSEYKFNDNLRLNYSTNGEGQILGTKYLMNTFAPTEFVVALDGTDWAPRHSSHKRINLGFLDGHVKLIIRSDLYEPDSRGSFPFWNWGFPDKLED